MHWQELALKNGIEYVEVSAKAGDGVEAVFIHAAKHMKAVGDELLPGPRRFVPVSASAPKRPARSLASLSTGSVGGAETPVMGAMTAKGAWSKLATRVAPSTVKGLGSALQGTLMFAEASLVYDALSKKPDARSEEDVKCAFVS